MPIAVPDSIALNVAHSAGISGVDALRAEWVSQPRAAATAGFNLGETGSAKPFAEAGKSAAPASFKRFEAMVLQTFIQNMLPKDGAAVYGKGMAGDMWKSLLAEKVAEVMADRGGIGIADRVLGERYASQAEAKPAMKAAEVSDAQQPDLEMSIAPAVVEAMHRSLSRLIADEPAASPEVKSQAEVQPTTKRG